MPAQLSATVANAAQEELISEEWSSLVVPRLACEAYQLGAC